MNQEQKPPDQKPKIVVDEDWKSQAEAARQKLVEQEKTAGPAAGPSDGDQQPGGLPPASFASLVSGLVTQILFSLGAIEDPRSRRRFRDLALAKHHIDTLAVLEEKTKGNLSPEEKRILDNALYEVRMAYVQVAQQGA